MKRRRAKKKTQESWFLVTYFNLTASLLGYLAIIYTQVSLPPSSFTSLSYSDASFLLEHGQNGKHPALPAQEYLWGLLSPET